MTLILGVEDPDNKRAIVFFDSGAWSGDSLSTLTVDKAIRCNGWIVGAAGRLWMQQALYRLPIEAMTNDTDDRGAQELLQDWAVKASARICALNANLGDELSSKETPSIVIAHDSRVWTVNDMTVIRTTDGYACAGAWNYAHGAMAALSDLSADDLAGWRHDEAWDRLGRDLRLGDDPRVCITTTPRATESSEAKALIRGMLSAFEKGYRVVRAVARVTTFVHGPIKWMSTDGTRGELE